MSSIVGNQLVERKENERNLILLSSDSSAGALIGGAITILGFHSRDQQPCFSTKTKEGVSIIIAFNSRLIGSAHQHGRHFILWGHQYGGRDVL